MFVIELNTVFLKLQNLVRLLLTRDEFSHIYIYWCCIIPNSITSTAEVPSGTFSDLSGFTSSRNNIRGGGICGFMCVGYPSVTVRAKNTKKVHFSPGTYLQYFQDGFFFLLLLLLLFSFLHSIHTPLSLWSSSLQVYDITLIIVYQCAYEYYNCCTHGYINAKTEIKLALIFLGYKTILPQAILY